MSDHDPIIMGSTRGVEVLEPSLGDNSLCDVLDRLLDKGVAIRGDVILRLANIDLVYLGLSAVLASVDTLRPDWGPADPTPSHTETPQSKYPTP